MMKRQWVRCLVLLCGGTAVAGAGWSVSAAAAGEETIPALTAATLPALGNAGGHKFVGSKKCKKCHIKQYKSWAKTKMAQAFNTLKPGEAAQAKEKFNLDVNKDYTQDPTCLKCHTTGYGQDGGYATPDPGDKKAVRAARANEGVGCESCHGAGGNFVGVFKDILKSKRRYKVEELYAVGLNKIDESTCKTCHNEKSPTYDASKPFDFQKRKKEGTHKHLPLKQRDG